jgi:hypothetical protein
MDGPGNGAFTYAFLKVWKENGDDYQKSYEDLQLDVLAAIENSDQEPQIYSYGIGVKEMVKEKPFSAESQVAAV